MTTATVRATLHPPTGRSTPSDAQLASRARTLTRIATDYHDLCEPLAGGTGVPGDGNSLNLTPHERQCLTLTKLGKGRECTCAYRTVREFERILGVMRDDRSSSLVDVDGESVSVRALRWHLVGWYVDAIRVTKHHPKPVKRGQRLAPAKDERILRDRNGAWVPAVTVQMWQRTPGARQVLADAGVRWVAGRWDAPFEPALPADTSVKSAAA